MSKGSPFDIPLFALLPLVPISCTNSLVRNHIFTKRPSVAPTCLLGHIEVCGVWQEIRRQVEPEVLFSPMQQKSLLPEQSGETARGSAQALSVCCAQKESEKETCHSVGTPGVVQLVRSEEAVLWLTGDSPYG